MSSGPLEPSLKSKSTHGKPSLASSLAELSVSESCRIYEVVCLLTTHHLCLCIATRPMQRQAHSLPDYFASAAFYSKAVIL